MDNNSNALNWFELPVTDISRAQKFYETIFDISMADMGEMMGMHFVGFPHDQENGKVSGALVKSQMHVPAETGVIIYLNADPSIQSVIDRVEAAGGKVAMPRTAISPEIGYMAFFIDTEGNKVGLHARN